jgi:hypothetical protein
MTGLISRTLVFSHAVPPKSPFFCPQSTDQQRSYASQGHCFCVTCTGRLLNQTTAHHNHAVCPVCRKGIDEQGHQLFIHFVDAPSSSDPTSGAIAQQARHITNGLDALDAHASENGVLGAGWAIEKVVHTLEGDDTAAAEVVHTNPCFY